MKNLFKALANFQQEVPIIHKDTQGYGYSYADLPKIFEVINPILKKHGLGFTQLIKSIEIETIIFHVESGEQITSSITIPEGVELKGMNQYQVLGSAITYLRRYALSAALGIVTDKDTGAAGEQVKKAKTPEPQKKVFIKDTAEYNAVIDLITGGRINDAREFLKNFQVTKEMSEHLKQIAKQ